MTEEIFWKIIGEGDEEIAFAFASRASALKALEAYGLPEAYILPFLGSQTGPDSVFDHENGVPLRLLG